MMHLAKLFFVGLFFSTQLTQAQKSALISLKPEAISAKALVEEMLIKRYSQELSSIIEKENFNLAVKLDLTEIPQKTIDPTSPPVVKEEPLSDLMLGRIDPENLLKKMNISNQQTVAIETFLKNYRIKAVLVSVGLSETLGKDIETEVTQWLDSRMKEEFGSIGKSKVSTLKIATIKPSENHSAPKNFLDWLEKFQSLFSQIIIVIGILFAVIVWKLMNKPFSISTSGDLTTSSNIKADSKNANTGDGLANSAGTGSGAASGPASGPASKETSTITQEHDLIRINNQILEIVPKITNDLEAIIRSWCQSGESGYLKLACFAEAIGQKYGKLPIPVDAMAEVSKVFTKMIDFAPIKKIENLQKAYWDILAVLNLGSDTLERPFGYISGMHMPMMQEILINQNLKMQTLASLFMTADQRKVYLKSLPEKSKIDLIKSAADLTEVSLSEFKTMDSTLKGEFKPKTDGHKVPFDMSLNKIAESLSYTDQIIYLPKIESSSLFAFKQSFATVAFLHEYPIEKLKMLLSRATADEICSYLSLKSEMTDVFINNCPPFTAEVVRDELSNKTQKMNPEEVENKLTVLSERLFDLIQSKQLQLSDVFPTENTVNNEKTPASAA